jgi:hypothetical protein
MVHDSKYLNNSIKIFWGSGKYIMYSFIWKNIENHGVCGLNIMKNHTNFWKTMKLKGECANA